MRRRGLPALVAVLVLAVTLLLAGCAAGFESASTYGEPAPGEQTSEDEHATEDKSAPEEASVGEGATIDEDGEYTSKDEVALYLHTYGHLPSNYITKDDAEDEGWKTEGLSLDEACPGMSIGGDRFGNRGGLLPDARGRKWYECDIDYVSGNRNAKRIVYSNDGLIYYTDDHYQSFERLY